ncbi:MAG: hypothetical protein WCV82_02150 [Candidatus Paceibacterota bacterium]
MNTLIHADIFFFVSTICFAVLTVLFVIGWIYGIRILANIYAVSSKARLEAEFLIAELGDIRQRIHEQTFGPRTLFRFIRRVFSRYY